MTRTLSMLAGTAVLGGLLSLAPVSPAAAAPVAYKNCTALHKSFPHGVARPGARDKVSGRSKPVTTFRVNKAVYDRNARLDRDKDGIACEKK
ncbi:excalibur calcium-binding domain-containing protein [Gordonia sp. FQ]|uniref:excalibur calcium-binding domain-containing protein n=1 Tax=Gordonia sp. FQ TaxID=3446634 RepID=UPI003F8654EA